MTGPCGERERRTYRAYQAARERAVETQAEALILLAEGPKDPAKLPAALAASRRALGREYRTLARWLAVTGQEVPNRAQLVAGLEEMVQETLGRADARAAEAPARRLRASSVRPIRTELR